MSAELSLQPKGFLAVFISFFVRLCICVCILIKTRTEGGRGNMHAAIKAK